MSAGRRNVLTNLQDPGCTILLQFGPIGVLDVHKETFAGREWDVYQVNPRRLLYSLPVNQEAYILGAELTEDYDIATKGACQRMVEEVIDTFTLVGD